MLFDLIDRRERRREVAHLDDPPARSPAESIGADLAGGVATEDLVLAEGRAQSRETLLQSAIELTDRLEVVRLRIGVVVLGTFDGEECRQRRRAERRQRHLDRAVAVRQIRRVGNDEIRVVQHRRAAHRVQEIGGEGHVQHLFDEHRRDHVDALLVGAGLNRVQRAHVGRQRGVFELDRALEMRAQVVERRDRISVHGSSPLTGLPLRANVHNNHVRFKRRRFSPSRPPWR